MVTYPSLQQVSDALQMMYNKYPNPIVKRSKHWRSDDDFSVRAASTILLVWAFIDYFSIFTSMKNCRIFIKRHLPLCLNLTVIALHYYSPYNDSLIAMGIYESHQ